MSNNHLINQMLTHAAEVPTIGQLLARTQFSIFIKPFLEYTLSILKKSSAPKFIPISLAIVIRLMRLNEIRTLFTTPEYPEKLAAKLKNQLPKKHAHLNTQTSLEQKAKNLGRTRKIALFYMIPSVLFACSAILQSNTQDQDSDWYHDLIKLADMCVGMLVSNLIHNYTNYHTLLLKIQEQINNQNKLQQSQSKQAPSSFINYVRKWAKALCRPQGHQRNKQGSLSVWQEFFNLFSTQQHSHTHTHQLGPHNL